ncbi:hypothetical protein [uncultured Draconibacterium sp.]|uniref:hypothetical protein n=1 Tax=uncultured Draconibacterium sp. TaxID=1573823 RepID=UPI0029C66C7D|nr:hypothetical protein [uncultured Draconibacterium sp.]
MKLKPLLLSLILLLTLSGCYNKFLSFVYNDKEIRVVRLHGKYPEIEIFDLRQQISGREIKTPGLFAMPGWHDKVYPKLTEEHKKEIIKGVNRQFTNEGENYKVTCILRNSMQKINVRLFKNRYFATVELEVFLNDDNDKLIDSYRTIEYVEYKTGSMIKDNINLLYNKALRNAVHKCFINLTKVDDIKSKNEYYRNSNIIKYKK